MNLQRLTLETTRENLISRFIDLLVPIAKGQRGLIIGPRYTGQKLILETIANSIAINHPELTVMMLLLDETVDEAAAMSRALKAEVCLSASDKHEPNHIHLAESALARAKGLVEEKRDVLVLVDSLTRLAEAYNEILPAADHDGPSAFNSYALRQTGRFFEAEGGPDPGGSLTIIGIVEIESPIPGKQMLFEQLKRTAEFQIILEQGILDQGIFPAVNIQISRNSKEEMFISSDTLARIWLLRKVLSPFNPIEATKLLGGKLLMTRCNREFLNNMSSI